MITTWTLVLYIFAGALAKGDSVAMLSVPNFKSESACIAEGTKGKKLVSGSTKNYDFICLKQEK